MTLLHPKIEPTFFGEPDAEPLIREARRLRCRGALGISVTVVIVGTGFGLVVGLWPGKPVLPRQSTTTRPGASQSSAAAAGVIPKTPGALAVSPNGDLYVVDTGRDQILRHSANGEFEVIAGTGKRGFSGDGDLAIDAKLDLSQFATSSGIAVAPNGTVYFSDSGNDRVRAVLKNGDIETVGGGGTQALPTRPGEQVSARGASLGSPIGLTLGPNNELYIAANFIVRLTPTGRLAWVAGTNRSQPAVCSATTCAMREQNFNSAGDLAFDGDGDLVVTSGGFPGVGWGIGEVRTNGTLVEFGNCRGEGGKAAALAPATGGSVICAGQGGLLRIKNGGESTTPMSGRRALSAALGAGRDGPFFGGDGIAVGPNGAIYVNTGPLASATPNAILKLNPSGTARALWKS